MADILEAAATRVQGVLCAKACICSYHCRLLRQIHLVNGHLGSILISGIGRPFKPEACNQNLCIKPCIPKLLLVFYIRLWFVLAVISVAFSNGGRLHIAMSFPKIMPPESEFFACIRTGQCVRIKELLGSGVASVADIVAPYGLTPLNLAIIHG